MTVQHALSGRDVQMRKAYERLPIIRVSSAGDPTTMI